MNNLLNKKTENKVQSIISAVSLAGIMFCICLLIILNFIIVPVKNISMLPTIYSTKPDAQGNAVNAYAFLLLTKNVSYNDIIVIEDTRGERLIKRVIGLPGDIIEIREREEGTGIYYLLIRNAAHPDGMWVDEPYIYEPMTIASIPHSYGGRTYYVSDAISEGEIFVMGDHRNESRDSRQEGPLLRSNIIGKAVIVYDRKHFIQFFFSGFEHKPLTD